MEYLIIDGYNIINSWPVLIDLKNYNLELARDKLIGMLQNYQGFQKMKIIIVFDGHLSKAKMRTFTREGRIQVIYTKKGETADALIERMTGELPPRSKITVVTNDWNEQRIILGKGALRMTSRELLNRLDETRQIIETRNIYQARHSKSIGDCLQGDVKKKLEEWRRKSYKGK